MGKDASFCRVPASLGVGELRERQAAVFLPGFKFAWLLTVASHSTLLLGPDCRDHACGGLLSFPSQALVSDSFLNI